MVKKSVQSCLRPSQQPDNVAGPQRFSRRNAAALLASSIVALQTAAARADEGEPPYFRAENSDVESATEGVKKEEKVAISSTSSTDPGTVRDGGKLSAGQVGSYPESTPAPPHVPSTLEKLPLSER